MKNDIYDKRLQDCGFKKIEDTDDIVVYERQQHPEYVQVLELGRHEDGKHRICSFQKGVNSDGFNNAVWLTLQEAMLAANLMIEKGW